MKKLLYIMASPSPEEDSISKKLGRYLVNQYLQNHPEYELEELALYETYIPELYPKYLGDEIKLAKGEKYNQLTEEEKKAVDRIDELGDQFIAADDYIIAAPMWDLSFPARLKMYIDCVCLGGKVLNFKDEKSKPEPLLNDKDRTMIYLQTAGGDYPFFLDFKINYGVEYCKALFKGLGVTAFKEILIEGVVQYEENPNKYLEAAYKRIDTVAMQHWK